MTDLRIVHASLRFDADTGSVTDYLRRVVRYERPDVLTCTEAQQRHIVRDLRRTLGKNWRVTRKGEYLICWRRDTLAGIPTRPPRLWHLTHVAGFPEWRQLRVGVRWLRHRHTGKRVRVMVGHCPAGVEFGDGWRSGRVVPAGERAVTARAVEASQRGLAAWGKRIHRRLGRGVVQVAVMDSNLDQHRAAWRAYLTGALHAPSIWARDVPKRGSHGHRLIDTAHVAGATVSDPHVCNVAKPTCLDHTAIAFRLRF